MSERYIYELHIFNCPKLVFGKASFKDCSCDGEARFKRLLEEKENQEVDRMLTALKVTRLVGQSSP